MQLLVMSISVRPVASQSHPEEDKRPKTRLWGAYGRAWGPKDEVGAARARRTDRRKKTLSMRSSEKQGSGAKNKKGAISRSVTPLVAEGWGVWSPFTHVHTQE